MSFDKIQGAVASGDVDAGVLIHEGQLTYGEQNLHCVMDLGDWWKQETGLRLPLGCNALRRDLDEEATRACCDALYDSVKYGLDNRDEVLDYAHTYARGLQRESTDKFVGMYVNDFTLNLGKKAEEAVGLLFKRGHEAGVIPVSVEPEFIG